MQFQQLQENYELTVADIHEQSLHEKENLKQSEDKLAQCNSAVGYASDKGTVLCLKDACFASFSYVLCDNA